MSLLLTVGFVLLLALLAFARFQVWRVERRYPPIGKMVDADGCRLHVVHVPASHQADLPPIVFIHGASGNLRDQMMAFRRPLEGRADLIFVDRPGHGWSQRGAASNRSVSQQAQKIIALLDRLNIDKAVIVGHSFGGAIASSVALQAPDRVSGLLLLSAATHPWPGGIAMHWRISATPLIGHIFTELLSMPVGLIRVAGAARCVFRPNVFPVDYLEQTGTALVLRPRSFRLNAQDIAGLFDHVVRTSPHYGEIRTPTVVITGDIDTIVSPDLHSTAIARQIEGAHLIRIRGVGHKPDFAATELCVAALERIAGMDVDLEAAKAEAERRAEAQQRVHPAQGGPGLDRADQIPLIPSDPI